MKTKEADVFRPNKVRAEREAPGIEPKITVYTISGKQTRLDKGKNPILGGAEVENSALGYAKKVVLPKNTRFYIKRNKMGHLFNPISMYGESSAAARRNDNQYREVTRAAFDKYLLFLKTKESTWISLAERELNG